MIQATAVWKKALLQLARNKCQNCCFVTFYLYKSLYRQVCKIDILEYVENISSQHFTKQTKLIDKISSHNVQQVTNHKLQWITTVIWVRNIPLLYSLRRCCTEVIAPRTDCRFTRLLMLDAVPNSSANILATREIWSLGGIIRDIMLVPLLKTIRSQL